MNWPACLSAWTAFLAVGGDLPAATPLGLDHLSDTWVATDALGRSLPTAVEVGPPRPDRTVGIFYFLWLGAHIQGGPYDVTRILAQDPDAMTKPDSPLWGPLHAPHHWGESLFGYYLTQDEGVLRKHAQMLADAGVDVVVFDVTNQVTYQADYQALLRVWSEVRAAGNRTPAVAFLTPFWDPAKVVRELWRDLYEPGLFPDLWFRWEGKPLILADPALILDRAGNDQQKLPALLEPGHTLGQTFTTAAAVEKVGGRFPTWNTKGSAMTLSLFRDGPAGERLARQRCANVGDNEWRLLEFDPPLPAGTYYLEMSEPSGRIGWWSHPDDVFSDGAAFADGQPATGDRTLRLLTAHPETRRLREFFTFRKPQPDYFQGPTGPNQWSWLEVSPQHVFTNTAGQKEQMSVGVGQNAVGNRLGSMSEPGARGRSYHGGATDARPNAVRWGLNVAEQWARALAEDPRFVFVTGWNEWIAGRFAEFNGVRLPVMFVDQFDQEHSRDIEPMRGGHGDDYYYQLVSHVRRYKGARPPPPVRPPPTVVDGQFADWQAVEPEFRDTRGDPVRRGHRGWDPNVTYENQTGRNDLVATKVSFDSERVAFYLRSQSPFLPPADPLWLVLFLDVDANPTNGWLGYDFRVVAPSQPSEPARLERRTSDAWQAVGSAKFQRSAAELELALPWSALGLSTAPTHLDFKWADHCLVANDWTDFTLNGDAAPNDRFNYRAVLKPR
ncbi:MAG: hypothetical protein HS113_10125 [Verrucomicrobiales bacterium]|nr:hypothetical protein [Verrucomicrobiales bacterium]